MFDVGDLPVLTFGNWVLKAEWLSGLWNYMYVFLTFFYLFFKIQKNMTFYVFLNCCTRFPEQCSQLRLMCMERRRFSQTMASEWQTAFVVSHKVPWRALLTAVKNYKKSLEIVLQDFFFETKTKTKCSRPRLHDPRPRPRPFLSSRRLETKTLVQRTTSLVLITM